MEFLPLVFLVVVGVSVLHPGVMNWFTLLMCDVVAFVCDVLVAVAGWVKAFVSAAKSSKNEVR